MAISPTLATNQILIGSIVIHIKSAFSGVIIGLVGDDSPSTIYIRALSPREAKLLSISLRLPKRNFGPLAIRLAKTMIFLSFSESGRYGLINVNYSMVKSGFTARICL